VRARLAIALACAAACGGRSEERPPAARVDALRAAAAGRQVVARVDGEPVYDDCVARQAAAPKDLRSALDDCIRFELLAQEALRRGYLADPEVAEVRRREMVRVLIGEFATTIDEPTDLPVAELQRLWEAKLRASYNRPERRRATYCRVGVKKKTPRGGDRDRKAKAYADQIHRAMQGMRFSPELLALSCHLASGGRKVQTTLSQTVAFDATGAAPTARYAREFADAAFSVDQVGHVSQPTRTDWGWDIVLVTEILPPESKTFAEAEPEIREMLVRAPSTADYRVQKFLDWLQRYAVKARIEVDPGALPEDGALAAGEEAHGVFFEGPPRGVIPLDPVSSSRGDRSGGAR
jgi:hypothetical protein